MQGGFGPAFLKGHFPINNYCLTPHWRVSAKTRSASCTKLCDADCDLSVQDKNKAHEICYALISKKKNSRDYNIYISNTTTLSEKKSLYLLEFGSRILISVFFMSWSFNTWMNRRNTRRSQIILQFMVRDDQLHKRSHNLVSFQALWENWIQSFRIS